MKEETGALKLRKARKHRRDPVFILPLNDPTDKKLGEIRFFGVINDRDRVFLGLFERWASGCVYFSQVSRKQTYTENGWTHEISALSSTRSSQQRAAGRGKVAVPLARGRGIYCPTAKIECLPARSCSVPISRN